MYDGSSFAANQDVVVVAFGYRINGTLNPFIIQRAGKYRLTFAIAFGFSNAPEIPISQQNAGFYDQRLALD